NRLMPHGELFPPANAVQAGTEFGAAIAVASLNGASQSGEKQTVAIGAPGFANRGRAWLYSGFDLAEQTAPWTPQLDLQPDAVAASNGGRFGASLAMDVFDGSGAELFVGSPGIKRVQHYNADIFNANFGGLHGTMTGSGTGFGTGLAIGKNIFGNGTQGIF